MDTDLIIKYNIIKDALASNYLQTIPTSRLEQLEIDYDHNFSTSSVRGIITADFSQSLELFGKINDYVIKHIDILLKRYDISPDMNFGQIIRYVINAEINRRIK